MGKNRISYIDVCKGLLIYLVFLGHILDYSSLSSTYVYAMHMPAFFLINGFLGGESYNLSFGKFVINRAKTYILPYFLFAMIGALVHIAWGYWVFLNKELFWTLFVTCMPDQVYIGAGWFLIASFWGNVFFYFWIHLLENNEKVTKTEKCVLLLIVMYLAVRILEFNIISVPQYNRLPWRIDSGLMAFAFMLIGHYIKKYNVIEKYQKFPVWIVSVYLFFSIAKANGWPNIANCSYNNGVYYYLAAVLGSFLIMSLALWIDKVEILSKTLGIIGKLSLPMFMLHGMFLSYMNTHMGIVTGTVPLKSAS